MLKTEGAQSWMYSRFSTPWPVTPRDSVLHITTSMAADGALLRRALCSVLERWRDANIVSSAANGLMNLAEPETRPVLVQALRHAVAADNRAVFQLLLALEAIDEYIYDPGLTTRSFDADEINRAAALRYLQRIDAGAPTG